jgi:ABC-type glycerol-3-phosphate transport system substrate-binding protein
VSPKTRKTIVIVAVAAACLCIAGAAVLWRVMAQKPEQATLILVHPLAQDGDVRALREVLAEFSSLYPHITVRESAKDPSLLRGAGLLDGAGEKADVVVATGPVPVGASVWASAPFQWTGTLWVLAARADVLAKQPDLAGAIKTLKDGTLSPDGFENLLGLLKSRNLVPLTLGNSHRWPFLIWLQHWAAATAGPNAVTTLPSGHAEQDKAFLARLAPAFHTLAGWKAKGWFSPGAWSQGWAQGLKPLADGSAVFALVSTPFLTAIPAETRQKLEFFPFPGQRGGAMPWTIGSVFVIGASASSGKKTEAALLVRYLTSPGVTRILSRGMARPFFSWSADAANPPQVIPDWYGAANTPELKVLEDAYGTP